MKFCLSIAYSHNFIPLAISGIDEAKTKHLMYFHYLIGFNAMTPKIHPSQLLFPLKDEIISWLIAYIFDKPWTNDRVYVFID